jgi:hypothetical protein
MKHFFRLLLVAVFLSSILYAAKDTVEVKGYYEAGTYGTLNDAIQAAVTAGTINNTVFKLKSYEVYVLSRSIYMDQGQNLEIVAPNPLRAGEADPTTVQNSAPPQILWTEEGIDRAYMIQSYGDVTLKNIWLRYSDFLGSKVSSSIAMENQDAANDPERIDLDGCLLDYDGIGSDAGGAVNCKGDHFVGKFRNCFWRNNSDNHFRYYGRAVSFPYQSTGWHYDSVYFENCTFTNISRICMIEGNEYGDNVQLNHCTVLNTIEPVLDYNGWNRNMLVANSIIVNPFLYGYRAVDVCRQDQTWDDYQSGLCTGVPNSSLFQITHVDSFAFQVPFTDQDRKIFLGNTAYMTQDWMKEWYSGCVWCKDRIRQRDNISLFMEAPMLAKDETSIIDSVNGQGKKEYKTMNVDWPTVYNQDPEFVVAATNQDTLKQFIEFKWSTAADIDWSYRPDAGFKQVWPLPENLAFNNVAYQTAAMGGFPLGDLNWYPAKLKEWASQRDAEWTTINNWLDYGTPTHSSVTAENGSVPTEYVLNQNYPNPFNPVTTIKYAIPVSGNVSLKIYNSIGQIVETIINGYQQAGNYIAEFNASNLSSGVYMYKLEAGNYSITKKLVVMK